DHPNRDRMEYFLNCVEEKLEQVPLDWRNWELSNDIIGGFKFENDNQSLTITVIFSNSYAEATEIAKANSLPMLPNAKWSINGDLLYLIESTDKEKVSEILSLFAGEE
ncbi:MAG TPA: hypothetical protein VIT44_04260, partial [Cyclobacteriaceae bacterium]